MALVKLELDLSKIDNLEQLHDELKKIFGFPDFYGKNINALIDCLSSLRFPEDGMSEFIIQKDDILIIEIKNLSKKNDLIINNLLIAIENVNNRAISWGQLPMIYMLLIFLP